MVFWKIDEPQAILDKSLERWLNMLTFLNQQLGPICLSTWKIEICTMS